ncbi:hypothetical protein CEJ42_11380 [Herbaspirillum robiniae]|uniref:Toxin n=1 Tax=Herbaspirillum robiniae TaxID=2014887 RepID=A0A246WSL1_9BURK|nr:hypothetical protein CEJ42_11380 [Herbaspirillum robiniae]
MRNTLIGTGIIGLSGFATYLGYKGGNLLDSLLRPTEDAPQDSLTENNNSPGDHETLPTPDSQRQQPQEKGIGRSVAYKFLTNAEQAQLSSHIASYVATQKKVGTLDPSFTVDADLLTAVLRSRLLVETGLTQSALDSTWRPVIIEVRNLRQVVSSLEALFTSANEHLPSRPSLIRAALQYENGSPEDYKRMKTIALQLDTQPAERAEEQRAKNWYLGKGYPTLDEESWQAAFKTAKLNDVKNWIRISEMAQSADQKAAFYRALAQYIEINRHPMRENLEKLVPILLDAYSQLFAIHTEKSQLSYATLADRCIDEAADFLQSERFGNVTADAWERALDFYLDPNAPTAPSDILDIAEKALQFHLDDIAAAEQTTSAEQTNPPPESTSGELSWRMHNLAQTMEYGPLAESFVKDFPLQTSEGTDRRFLQIIDTITQRATPAYRDISRDAWDEGVLRNSHLRTSGRVPEVIPFISQLSEESKDEYPEVTKTKIDTSLRIKPLEEYTWKETLDNLSKALKNPGREAATFICLLTDASEETTARARELGDWFSTLSKTIARFHPLSIPLTALENFVDYANRLAHDRPIDTPALENLADDAANLWSLLRPTVMNHPSVKGDPKLQKELGEGPPRIRTTRPQVRPAAAESSAAPKPAGEAPDDFDLSRWLNVFSQDIPVTPPNEWSSSIDLNGKTPDAQGMFSVENKYYVMTNDATYRVEFDSRLNAWMIIRPDGMSSKLYSVRYAGSGRWRSGLAGLRGGGNDGGLRIIPEDRQTDYNGHIRTVTFWEKTKILIARATGIHLKPQKFDTASATFKPTNDLECIQVSSTDLSDLEAQVRYMQDLESLEETVSHYQKLYRYLKTVIEISPDGKTTRKNLYSNMETGEQVSNYILENGLENEDLTRGNEFHYFAAIDKSEQGLAGNDQTSALNTRPLRTKAVMMIKTRNLTHKGRSSNEKEFVADVSAVVAHPFTQLDDSDFRYLQEEIGKLQRIFANRKSNPGKMIHLESVLFRSNINQVAFENFLHEFPDIGGNSERIKGFSEYMTSEAMIALLPRWDKKTVMEATPINPRTISVVRSQGFKINLSAAKQVKETGLYQIYNQEFAKIGNKVYEVKKKAGTDQYEAIFPHVLFRPRRDVFRDASGVWKFGRRSAAEESMPGPSRPRASRSITDITTDRSTTTATYSMITPRPLPDTLYMSSSVSPEQVKLQGGFSTPASASTGYDHEANQLTADARNAVIDQQFKQEQADAKEVLDVRWKAMMALGRRIAAMTTGDEKDEWLEKWQEEVNALPEAISEHVEKVPTFWDPFQIHIERLLKKTTWAPGDPLPSYSGGNPFIMLSSSYDKEMRFWYTPVYRSNGFIFSIAPDENVIDVKSTLGQSNIHRNERDWAVREFIPWNRITGWFDQAGTFTANPDYVGRENG